MMKNNLLWVLTQVTQTNIEMADVLRANGKIYVVVAVVVLVVLLMVVYLIRLDRKIGKLENEMKEKRLK